MSIFENDGESGGGVPWRLITSMAVLIVLLFVLIVFKAQLAQLVNNLKPQHPPANDLQLLNSKNFTPNSTWVSNFFSNLSTYRTSPLTECTDLDKLADIRLKTLLHNYSVVHYGYAQDLAANPSLLAKNGEYSEEYFQLVTLGRYGNNTPWFPYALHTPAQQIEEIRTLDIEHWAVLVSSTYSYYGYTTGILPWILPNRTCNTGELYGGENLTQLYSANASCGGYFTTNETWFIIELGSACES